MEENSRPKRSGEGVKPLSVRRSVGVSERINSFIEKLQEVDAAYMPPIKWLLGSNPDRKRYKEQYSAWLAKLRDIVKTERRFLAPEGTVEGSKKAKIRANTYRVRLSLYRRHIIQKLEYINPLFFEQANKYISSELFSEYANNKVKSLCQEEKYSSLMKKIRDILYHDADRLTDAEYAAIKDLKSYSHHPVLKMLSVGERLGSVIKKKDAESQTARHTTAVRKISINFYLAWMDRILANYTEHDWANIAIALALSTGRRPIELFVTGRFSEPDGNTVLFSGQAKTKLADGKKYRIPLLYDVSVIQSALKKMRKGVRIPDGSTNDDVNRITAKTLSDRMRVVFEKQSVEFYAMRAAYARLCVQKFYDKNLGTEEHFLASILGHSEDDYATVQHYKTVVFTEELSLEDSIRHWDEVARKDAESLKGGFITPELIASVMSHKDKFQGARARVFDFIIDQLKRGNTGLTQSYITREGGFSRDAIKAVLLEVGEITPSEAHKAGRRREFLRA